jgi:hypothetical protein
MAQPVAPEYVDGNIEPSPQAPPHEPHAGCGCANCQGATQFPGYDNLPYPLQGGCPPVVISEAWCRRPFFFDVFVGAITGNEFIDNQVGQRTSLLYGGRFGWDFDGEWGVETRLALSQVDIYNLSSASNHRQADLLMADVSLVHYFGSSLTIRPFLSVGLGVVDWSYVDAFGMATDEQVAGVPIAIGVKQRYDDWLVLRLDLADNIAFGGGTQIGTQHNISLTGNVEIRFGGPRTSYWAWAPRKHYSW